MRCLPLKVFMDLTIVPNQNDASQYVWRMICTFCSVQKSFLPAQERISPQRFQALAGYQANEDWSLTISVTDLAEPCTLKAWLEQEARRRSWGRRSRSFNSFSEEAQDGFIPKALPQGVKQVPRCSGIRCVKLLNLSACDALLTLPWPVRYTCYCGH